MNKLLKDNRVIFNDGQVQSFLVFTYIIMKLKSYWSGHLDWKVPNLDNKEFRMNEKIRSLYLIHESDKVKALFQSRLLNKRL